MSVCHYFICINNSTVCCLHTRDTCTCSWQYVHVHVLCYVHTHMHMVTSSQEGVNDKKEVQL